MFQSLGTDYKTFGTVAESEENWTQRTKTEWETSWQSKMYKKNPHGIFFIFTEHLKRKKIVTENVFFCKRVCYQISRTKSFKHFKTYLLIAVSLWLNSCERILIWKFWSFIWEFNEAGSTGETAQMEYASLSSSKRGEWLIIARAEHVQNFIFPSQNFNFWKRYESRLFSLHIT